MKKIYEIEYTQKRNGVKQVNKCQIKAIDEKHAYFKLGKKSKSTYCYGPIRPISIRCISFDKPVNK